MYRRPQYFAIGIVLLLGLIFISLPERASHQLKLAISSFYLPLFGLVGSAHSLLDQGGNSLRSKKSLLEEIEKLRRENQQFKAQAAQGDEVLAENQRLREALGFQKTSAWKLQPAKVSGRDPANWWRTLRIDRGQRDGVVTNLPVLSPDGFLVGRIQSVGHSHSQVVLIGDPNCQVAALVDGADPARRRTARSTRLAGHGVIKSGSSHILDPTVVDLMYLDRESSVQPGQRVFTSGLGEIFPPGIPIGQVAEAKILNYGLHRAATVKLSADIGKLEEVWVKFP